MLPVSESGSASTSKSARLPTSVVPNSCSCPRKRDAARVPALRATNGVKATREERCRRGRHLHFRVPDLDQILGSHEATLLKRHNDVYRVDEYFVKLHTKAWYEDDPRAWAGAVQHEAAAYACIAQHGLAAPKVVVALTSSDNSLGRPCLVTRALQGEPLTSAAKNASRRRWQKMLESAGEYMRRLHAITFANAGYIMLPGGAGRRKRGL